MSKKSSNKINNPSKPEDGYLYKYIALIPVFIMIFAIWGLFYFGNSYGVKNIYASISIIIALLDLIPLVASLTAFFIWFPNISAKIGRYYDGRAMLYIIIVLPAIFFGIRLIMWAIR